MSERYVGAWEQAGLFNPLTAPTPITNYTYYLYSWGADTQGALGLGNITSYSSPKQVGALTNWAKIYAGGNTNNASFAIKTDGTLWGDGYNAQGQLGQGNTTNYSSPVQVGSLTNWKQVACGYRNTAAIQSPDLFQ